CRILRNSDSTYRWHLGRGIPFCDQAGNLIKWFGTFTDIQDQKASIEKVHRALEIRDEFLSIVSHELKTPMTTLKIQVQRQQKLLANHMEGTVFPIDDLWPMLEESDLQIERMKRLINDMLDVSRMNFDQIGLDIEKFDLYELIKTMSERFAQQCQMSGCTLILTPSESVFGEWDRGRVEQVISNLIINAIKYGKKSPITISLEKKPLKVLIHVHDKGIGISEKDQIRIFNRFERAVASDSPISGLGLGLYIVKRIVELHKGHVHVQSEINKGTTFTVTLPL
nr:ATP-binding protein [Pseudobdellovibrionaceae bacterium]